MTIKVRLFLDKQYIAPDAAAELTIRNRTIDRIVNDVADGRQTRNRDHDESERELA